MNATYCYDKTVTTSTTYDCSCTDVNDYCVYFNGPTDCNLIFQSYSHALTAAAWFDWLTFLLILTLSIISCCSTCCPANFGRFPSHQSNTIIPAPTVVYYSDSNQSPVYTGETSESTIVYAQATSDRGSFTTGAYNGNYSHNGINSIQHGKVISVSQL
jgi:hypothetical protein